MFRRASSASPSAVDVDESDLIAASGAQGPPRPECRLLVVPRAREPLNVHIMSYANAHLHVIAYDIVLCDSVNLGSRAMGMQCSTLAPRAASGA